MATRGIRRPGSRDLLERILETPDLARVVQGLEPRVLHRLVRKCGLEDSSPIIALSTPDQLMRIFDDDLWRSEEAGGDERLDADRFALWLEVLCEAGPDLAARKVAEMDFDFVTAAFSRHVLVLDGRAIAIEQEAVDMGMDDGDPTVHARGVCDELALENGLSHEIGGYRVVARRGEAWDALISVLTSLDAGHHAFFGRLMGRCAAMSVEYIVDNGGLYEVLTSEEQALEDATADRDQRREREGYVTPSQAIAFLKLCRREIAVDGAPPPWDHGTTAYFREMRRRAEERAGGAGTPSAASRRDARPSDANDSQADRFLATLRDAGVLPVPQASLLANTTAEDGDRLARIRGHLLRVQEHDATEATHRQAELAYLANVLVAGCSFQSRRFRTVEAADAVLAVCNLGLESWPRHWPGVTEGQELVTVFRLGWSVLHVTVCLHVARCLVAILSEVTSNDVRGQLTELARRLRSELQAGTPWRARDDLDVIAVLDQPSWAALLGLVDECPVVPRASDRPDGRPPLRMTTAFEFISESRQLRWVRDFMASLPDRLRG